MAHASRMETKLRKVRRERTLAFRLYNVVLEERNQARMVASALEAELKKYITKYGELPNESTPRTNSVTDELNAEATVVQ